MQLDGYRFKWNKILIIFRKIDDKIKGKERPFDQTLAWKQAEFYMDFYRNVDENSKADKIPLRKSVEALEKQLEKNKNLNLEDIISLGVIPGNLLCQTDSFSNADSGHFSQDSSASSSLASIPSTQSSAGLNRVSCVSNLFTNELNNYSERRIKKIYTNKSKHTKDVVLSENDSFLDDIVKNRIKPAISFRKCVRVSNVTKKEMLILEDNPKKPMILGNRVN
ncbi:MAG TPA: hypothetical protein VGH95_05235 [Candidatus Aquirickettsiella sp.]|jgi:hypothetical protein